MLRGLIDSIVLMPEKGQLRIDLRGNLAAMLTAAQKTRRSPETGDLFVPVQCGCGGVQPAVLAAVECRKLSALAARVSESGRRQRVP